ncbi:MAG: RpiB/LacA/LacB family sugar-phosphate isomerase, partial [Alphaproteobacteria bacterium]
MKIVIGSDHAGFHLKTELAAFLESEGHQVEDIG